MSDLPFQISEEQWQDSQRRLAKLEVHRHTGIGDSLQLDPAQAFMQQQLYGVYAKVTLTSAQILALHTTPVALVPAKGAGTFVVVDSIDAKLVFNSVAYTGANGLTFSYAVGGASVAAQMGTTFLNGSSTLYDHVAGTTSELAPAINSAVNVSVGTANPGAGNSTITFITKYRVLTF